MTDTIIVSGGDIQRDFALDFLKREIEKTGREKICLIAADRGLEFFLKNQIRADVAVGDFDSLSEEGKLFLKQQEERRQNTDPKTSAAEGCEKHTETNLEIIRLKPEKDDSDTQSAMNLAIRRGAKKIAILGVTGKRVDHLMAHLGLLKLAQEQGTEVALVDAYNYMTLITSGTVLKKEEQFGKYVSFFSMGGDVTGLTLEGFKYPLHGHHLTVADSGLTVSNEIKDDTAKVTYTSGNLLMIMSRD